MMDSSIRTTISVSDLKDFEFFLDSNGLCTVRIGFYSADVTIPHLKGKGHSENFICYEYSNTDTELTELLTYMTLKYGSLQAAYKDYRNEMERIANNTTFMGYR